MLSFEQQKLIERDRYDQRARALLDHQDVALGPDGAASQPLTIRAPYLVYEDYIRRSVTPGAQSLDVCCGTGLYSLIAAGAGATATASDIAEHNLALARRRAERAGLPLHTVSADAEQLPFRDQSFDIVTCAGSLSYVEPTRFLAEVRRILRPGGWFVCIDSLNHNPVYRLNRYVQYLRGRRTKATLLRMPTLDTVRVLNQQFGAAETSFHGAGSFLAPVIKPLLGEDRTAGALDRFDRRWPELHRWAFKFVFRGRRPEF
jgi:SAM-dependent methyltransferase